MVIVADELAEVRQLLISRLKVRFLPRSPSYSRSDSHCSEYCSGLDRKIGFCASFIGITGFSGFLDRLLERQAGKSTEHCVATGVNIPLRHFGRGMTGNSGEGPGVTTRLAQPCQESVSKPSSPGQ